MTEFDLPPIDDPRAMGLALLQESVLYQMYRTAMRGTLAKSEYIEKEVGLRMAEWKVMLIIGAFGPVSTKEIAERSSLDKPSISRTSEKLVARKLATSAENPGDRRKVALTLTKAGRAKYVKLLHALSSWDKSLLECLGADQIETLKTIVDLLFGHIDSVSGALDRAEHARRRVAGGLPPGLDSAMRGAGASEAKKIRV